jgi:hypothetical protein
MIAIAIGIAARAWSWGAGLLGGRVWLVAGLAGAVLAAWIAGALINMGTSICEGRHAAAVLAAKRQDEAENRALRARAQAREHAHMTEIATLKERNHELEQALAQIKPNAACARCRIDARELRLLNR